MGIGLVKFDDPDGVGAGWASFNGEPAMRIRSVGDLASSQAWIVDMKFHAFRDAQLWKIPHIKRLDYMRVKPPALAGELNLQCDWREMVEVLSGIYGKTAEILSSRYGLDVLESEKTAAAALQKRVGKRKWPVSAEMAEGVSTAVIESTHESQNCIGKAPVGSSSFGASFPRSAYASYLESLPLPAGPNWTMVKRDSPVRIGYNKGKLEPGTDEWIKNIIAKTKGYAVFLETTVLGMPAMYAKTNTFGQGANTPRRWACLPEILHLAKFAHLEVGEGYATPFSINTKKEPIHSDPTISGGIASEILWVAKTLPSYQDDYNPVGAYLRAYDRIACSAAASKLNAAGYQIGSYGAGRVFFYAMKKDNRIAEHLLSCGLLPRPSV